MATTYHRLIRGSHSRWEKGESDNTGRRVIYKAGDSAFPDTMADLSEAELATLGTRVQEVDGPQEAATTGTGTPNTPVRPRDYSPRGNLNPNPNPAAVSPLDNLQPLPVAKVPKDYSAISDLGVHDVVALVAEAGTIEEVEGLMAAEEAGKGRKTVLDAGERRLAQLQEGE